MRHPDNSGVLAEYGVARTGAQWRCDDRLWMVESFTGATRSQPFRRGAMKNTPGFAVAAHRW